MLNRVQELRERNGRSSDELAMVVGVSSRYLASLEAGDIVPNVDVALRLARELDSSVEDLFSLSHTEERFIASEVKAPEKVVAQSHVISSDTSPDDVVAICENSVEQGASTSCVPASDEKTPQKRRRTSNKKKSRNVVSESQNSVKSQLRPSDEVSTEPEKLELEPVAPYVPQVLGEELHIPEDEPLFEEATEVSDVLSRSRRVYAPRKSQTISSHYSRTATEEGLAASPEGMIDPTVGRPVRYFDLFCGIGGFRFAVENVLARMERKGECVLSCDIDPHAQDSYAANFGERPVGDVSRLPSDAIPDFDLLFAGFPCQTFSIIGLRKGFADETKGSLFFQIARILRDKRPRAFVLENVRQLTTHDKGRTFEVILRTLQDELGYYVDWRVLNALDCGLPQKRERVVVVGSTAPFDIEWPRKTTQAQTLQDILEPESQVPEKYKASPEIVQSRKKAHRSQYYPSVWHENKSGFVSSYPYSCALRAGASHNYLLVNGERRFTPLELLRLQGFPDDFKITVSYTQLRKQIGNAAPVNLVERALERFLPLIFKSR